MFIYFNDFLIILSQFPYFQIQEQFHSFSNSKFYYDWWIKSFQVKLIFINLNNLTKKNNNLWD